MFRYLESNKNLIYASLIIYWIILLIATSLPAKNVPSIGVSDKFEHFGAYFVLAFLLLLTLSIQNKYPLLKAKALLFTLIIVSLYGIADEFHQLFIPGRDCEFYDWLSDFTGVILAVVIGKYLLMVTAAQKNN